VLSSNDEWSGSCVQDKKSNACKASAPGLGRAGFKEERNSCKPTTSAIHAGPIHRLDLDCLAPYSPIAAAPRGAQSSIHVDLDYRAPDGSNVCRLPVIAPLARASPIGACRGDALSAVDDRCAPRPSSGTVRSRIDHCRAHPQRDLSTRLPACPADANVDGSVPVRDSAVATAQRHANP